MLRGALVGIGVTWLLILIPIVHFVTALPSPFIGGFVGGSRARALPHQAWGIGLLMGLFIALPMAGAISSIFLLFVLDGTGTLVFVSVIGALTFIYVGTLGSLGAMLGGRMARLHPGGKRCVIR